MKVFCFPLFECVLKMARRLRDLKVPEKVRNTVLIILCIAGIDVLVASLGPPFLGETVWFFSDKSAAWVLSDLLFLEGAVVFTIGAFIAGGVPVARLRSRVRFGATVMIIGGAMICSSIVIGTFMI
jgi:hypothetical protein